MSSSEQNDKPLLTLRSSDGEYFRVEKSVVVQFCRTIKNIVDNGALTTSVAILIPKVDAKTLALVLEYCREHAAKKDSSDHPDVHERLNRFDAEFVKVDMPVLYDLLVAAYFLNVKKLLAGICKEFAGRGKDRMPEEIRKLFDILHAYAQRDEAP